MPKATASKVDEHHDRLVRLEEGVTATKVDIGVLKAQVSDGFEMLAEKMDSLNGLKDQVEAMEITEKVRYRVFKIAVSVVVALAGVAGFFLKLVLG